MYYFRSVSIALFLSLFLSCVAPQVQQNFAPPATIQLDNRSWKLGNANSKDVVSIAEYAPEGQTVENWKELITIINFSGDSDLDRLRNVVDLHRIVFYNKCPAGKFKILTEKKESIAVEHAYQGCGNYEHDVSLYILSDTAVVGVTYASKEPLSEEQVTYWYRKLAEGPAK
ncbi:MAG: hypothetical protein KDK37_12890 [Leptospiraceae bacterium]|nr:hypothetical protein [Leptospiraceae bacterium]